MFVGLKCRDAQTHPVISQLVEVTYIRAVLVLQLR